MNVVIVEDEPLVTSNLRKMVQKAEPDAHVLAVLAKPENSDGLVFGASRA